VRWDERTSHLRILCGSVLVGHLRASVPRTGRPSGGQPARHPWRRHQRPRSPAGDGDRDGRAGGGGSRGPVEPQNPGCQLREAANPTRKVKTTAHSNVLPYTAFDGTPLDAAGPSESEAVGTRTRDLRIKSPLLYQLSYNPEISASCYLSIDLVVVSIAHSSGTFRCRQPLGCFSEVENRPRTQPVVSDNHLNPLKSP
jgi:hypothetical protein